MLISDLGVGFGELLGRDGGGFWPAILHENRERSARGVGAAIDLCCTSIGLYRLEGALVMTVFVN